MVARVGATAHDRTEIIDHARSGAYDIVIVGGGIAGAGVARDAAMRGHSVLLVEREDFCAGTTAGSTRLIHGGLRYLEQYDFGLVFESLQEREVLKRLAPHLVTPLTFILPQYDESRRARLKLHAGMVLYDLLSYNKTMPWHEYLSAAAVREREPGLPADDLQGGFVYHDCQVAFVERLVLETVLDAVAHGADVLNHAAMTDLRVGDGRVRGITVQDRLGGRSFDVAGEAVVNATGAAADRVLEGYVDRRLVRPTKGIHLVVPELTTHALTLPTSDDRVIFVVPWDGRSLIGTTDTDFDGDPADARATPADVRYLLSEAGRYFPTLTAADVLYTYAGVRPLYDGGGDQDESAVSRAHRVIAHELDGLFSLVGAKITTARHAAAELTDAVEASLDRDEPCRTATIPLPGGRGEAVAPGDCPPGLGEHLTRLYGSRTRTVLDHIDREPRLGEPLCPHTDDVLAQVTLAVEAEHARTLSDVMLRRCTVGYAECEGLDAIEPVAAHMAELLGWDDERVAGETDRYRAIVEDRHVDPVGGPLPGRWKSG